MCRNQVTLVCPQVLVFFTWVVRGVADTVSMWDAVERVTSFATQVGCLTCLSQLSAATCLTGIKSQHTLRSGSYSRPCSIICATWWH